MVKFLAFAVTACFAIASVQTQAQSEREPCDTFNFKDRASDLGTINSIVDVAASNGVLAKILAPYDSFSVQNKTLDAIPVSMLGMEFAITPSIKTLTVNGLANTVPHKVEVEAKNNIKTGAYINGTVVVSSTLSFKIQQLHKKKWHICWTSLLHPMSCPPKVIDVDFGTSVYKPSVGLDMLIEILQCSSKAHTGTCTDLTNIITAAMDKKFDEALPRLLQILRTVSINELTLGFDKINSLDFKFYSSHTLANEISKKLLAFTAMELSRKEGDLHKIFIEKSQAMLKKLGNQVIEDKFKPTFGNTCYEN